MKDFVWVLILCTSSCRAMGDVSDRIGRPTDNGQVKIYCLVTCLIEILMICVFGVAAKLEL